MPQESRDRLSWESTGFFTNLTEGSAKGVAVSAESARVRPRLPGDPRYMFPLRLKLALSFSLLLLLLSAVVGHFLVRYERAFLQAEAEKRVRSLAVNLAATARDPLLSEDHLRVGPMVESTMLGSDVLYAYVSDHEGRVVYHSNPKRTGSHAAHRSGPGRDEGRIEARQPIDVEGVRIGSAVVAAGTKHIEQALHATLTGVLVPLVVTTVIGIIGIFLLAGVHMKKMGALLKAFDDVGTGNLAVRLPAGGRDEIGRLARRFNVMVERIDHAQDALAKNFKETIGALAAAVEARDAYTRGHCERVARISRALGRRLALDGEALNDLELAAILHDIGKIGTEQEVLGKEGVLARDERGKMQRHTDIGAKILEPISFLARVGVYVRHHHEKFSGGGYPDGLAGEAIPLPSRIITLVDAFDAMVTDRSYRRALPKAKALERIRKGSGEQFDPELVRLFLAMDDEGLIDAIRSDVAERLA